MDRKSTDIGKEITLSHVIYEHVLIYLTDDISLVTVKVQCICYLTVTSHETTYLLKQYKYINIQSWCEYTNDFRHAVLIF